MSLKDWAKKITRMIKAKNNKVDTKGMMKGQKRWHNDDENFPTGLWVSRLEEFEDEDSIRMKSHVKTISSMCMGTTYSSMKVLLWFFILSMIVWQVYPHVVHISIMVVFTRLCQSHIVARLCYFFLFVMIWSLDPKHKRNK